MTSDRESSGTDPGLDVLARERGQLINLAYRLLGSLADAEDAVQEATARWYTLSPEQRREIASPGAWLSTVVSRVCLDVLKSARTRRERYVGQWIPEPVPDTAEWGGSRGGPAVDPADRITLDESVDMAFLVVLDSMTPAERVAFLLHDVFRYSFDEVARIVGRTPGACRQLASSARRRVREQPPVATPGTGRGAVVRRFKQAWEAQDIRALIDLLDPSAVAVADGGGLASASLHPIEGNEEIARYLVGLSGLARSFELLERTVNGQPGLVAIHQGSTAAVYAFGIVHDRIQNIWVVRNPEKLGSWNAT